MSEDFDYSFNSKIKSVFLEVPDYKFKHQSLGESDDSDENFRGREEISRSFKEILKSENRRGVYLVTGYRGMGKTSFVKKVPGWLLAVYLLY